MGTLGEDLKAAREQKGLTLKEISDKTRISINFLKALEEDSYSVIPGETFVTGFLRTYAKELGLKEKEILARYREARQLVPEAPPVPPSERPEEPQLKPKPSIISFQRDEKEKEKGWPLWLLVLLGVLLIIVPTVISLYITRMKAPETGPPAAPAPKPMAIATTAFRPGTTFRQATALKPRTTAAPAEVVPLKVKLTAAETTWYSIRKNGGPRVSAILKAGETTTFEAKDRIVLDVGNAGGVKIEFNGKVLKPYGKRGEAVKGITFTQKLQGVVIAPKPVMPARTSHVKAPEPRVDNTPERKAVTESTTAEPKAQAIAEPKAETKAEPKAEPETEPVSESDPRPLLFIDKK